MRLEKVGGKNIWELMKLEVKDEQESFVAPNTTSILEAYVTITSGGQVWPFGIYEGKDPVGFLMISYGVDESWENPPPVARDNYVLWRLMIDKRVQGRGYGRRALGLALDFIRTFPCGEAEYCWLSYEPENFVARRLYQSFGFEEIKGMMDGDEQVALLRLSPSADVRALHSAKQA